MSKHSHGQVTLSVRLIWPVARALDGHPIGDEMLAQLGITAEQFVDPETRVPAQLALNQLDVLAKRLGDPTIGLRSGQTVDFADFDILEHAARGSASLGEAQDVMWRYMGLMHEGLTYAVTTEDNLVYSHYIWADGVQNVPACVNDFTIACALGFSQRNMAVYTPPTEVHMMHPRPAYADAYAQYFGCPVKFDAPNNAIVMTKERAASPMRAQSRALSEAFELQAKRLLEKMQGEQSLAGRVHADVAKHLASEQVSMERTSKRLAMGVATLRRKLEDEGTTFSVIVDDLRRDLAERYLKEKTSAIGEIAFLLGFSDVRAFGRAFKRWTNVSPSEYRAGKR